MNKVFKLMKNPLIIIAFCIFWFFFSIWVIAPAIDYFAPLSEIPYGKWQSFNPDITICKNNERTVGIYIKDEEIIIISIWERYKGQFSIYSGELEEDGNDSIPENEIHFIGSYKLKNNKLYYKLRPSWRQKTGYKTIIFELTEAHKTE